MRKLLFLFALIMLAGCGPNKDLDGLDEEAWKSDKNGCQGKRQELAGQVKDVKEELMGFNQNEIKSLFGPPDRHELSRRNRKYFLYFIEPGPDCNTTPDASPKILLIGFDALGRTNEVLFQQN